MDMGEEYWVYYSCVKPLSEWREDLENRKKQVGIIWDISKAVYKTIYAIYL